MADFRLSIVIPFYRDNKAIGLLLASVERACLRLPAHEPRPEVIVVDDHSPLPFEARNCSLPVRVERLKHNAGVGGARNRGAALASGTHILFMDSDVILSGDFFVRLYRHLDQGKGPIIQGPVSPVPANDPATLFHHYMAVSWHYYHTQHWDISIFTQCFAIEKAFFNQLGGFSERYQKSGGEEFELGLRLARLGTPCICFDPELVHRHHSESLVKRLRKVYFRSRHIRQIALAMPNLPFRFTAQSLMRSFFALLLWLCLLLALGKPSVGLGLYLLMGGLFYVADEPISRCMRTHHSLRLSLMSVVYRQLEYTFINLGMLKTLVAGEPRHD